jgi:hypothetical protein
MQQTCISTTQSFLSKHKALDNFGTTPYLSTALLVLANLFKLPSLGVRNLYTR